MAIGCARCDALLDTSSRTPFMAWRQVTLGAGSAAPNTSGEASDGEKSDGEAGDALPSSATDVGGAVATGGEGSGVERG